MKKLQKTIKSVMVVAMIAPTMLITSCDFMMGFAQGMAAYNYYNPYGYNNMNYGNTNYSLDPNVIWNQAGQKVQQQQQVMNNMAQRTWEEAGRKVEKEQQQLYNELKNLKKWDGSSFTEAEIMQMVNEINSQNLEYTKTSSVSSTSHTSNKSSSYSSNKSCPRCGGTGRISYETKPPHFGGTDYKVRCNECGKEYYKSLGHTHITCPLCHGHK